MVNDDEQKNAPELPIGRFLTSKSPCGNRVILAFLIDKLQLMMAYETVHTMTDWYDGPRRGVAMVNNRPHLYLSCWSNIDSDDDDVFLLSPISDETLNLAIEDWQIWERWSLAHKDGKVTLETHPCLPPERERHLQLKQELRTLLVLNELAMFAATAIFQYNFDRGGNSPFMLAEWTMVPFDPAKDKRAKYESIDDNDDDQNI